MIILFSCDLHHDVGIEDRNEALAFGAGCASAARGHRSGKGIGRHHAPAIQGLIFLVFAPLVGVHFTLASFGLIVLPCFWCRSL